MEINIPFERIAGGLLLAMVALVMIAGSISGYDTSREGFDSELRRLAELSSFADNLNAGVRLITGVALIGAAAGFYVGLRERGAMLATIASFGLVASGALVLVAGAMQVVFVDLAEEYVGSTGAHQEQVLVTARAVGMVVQYTVGTALLALMASAYSLAVLTARERLVPRWLIGFPAFSVLAFVAGGIAGAAGAGNAWIVFISGVGSMLLWMIIAGVWLILNPRQEAPSMGGMSPAPTV